MMNKIRQNKGFTLAELLIVVAIIAVLVAVAIPVFTQQLEKAAEATDIANIRSAYAEATADLLGTNKASAVASTTKAQSTGNFEYADVSGITFYDLSTISVNKGTAFTVTVYASASTTVSN